MYIMILGGLIKVSEKEFGEYLRKIRKLKKITIRELAHSTGISQSYLSQIETGSRGVPTEEVLLRLANGLGVNFADILKESGRENAFDGSIRHLINLFGSAIASQTSYSDAVEEEFIGLLIDLFEEAGKSTVYNNDALISNHEQYAELIIKTGDNDFKWVILEKLKDLAQKFHLWKQPNNATLPAKDTSKDLSKFLRQQDITYGSEPLTEKDRSDIAAIIEWHLRDRILPS
jgi:transcriptional regulator with XRE-family HTH domain